MTPEHALVDIITRLQRLGVAHALVGGLAISIRAEVRFTRDVDLAVSVESDSDVERITRALAAEGFNLVAVVEQDDAKRIAIARLRSPSGIVVDLLAASSMRSSHPRARHPSSLAFASRPPSICLP